MKKFLTILSVAALLIVSVAATIPAMAAKTTATSGDWKAVTENSSAVFAEETAAGTKLSFKNTSWGGDYMATTTKAYKLDGLYIRINNITLPGQHCINLAFGTQAGTLTGPGLLFLANNFGSTNLAFPAAGGDGVSVGEAVAPVANSARTGLSVFFARNDDGSFTVFRAGTDSKRFTLTADQVKTYFGSEDPEVYVTVTDNWWGSGAGENNSFVVAELSTGNTNGFTDYSDVWGRDLYVTQEDALTNIVINHNSNHGAVSNLMKPVPLNGLTLKDVEISFSAMFRFAISLNALSDNQYAPDTENGGDAGFLVRVDKEKGRVYCTYSTGGGADDEIVGYLGEDFTTFTLQIVKQPNGDYVVFVTSDAGTEVQITLAKADLEWAFGEGKTDDVKVNIAYTSYEDASNPIKTVKIAKIFNESNFDAVAPENAKAELKDGVVSAEADIDETMMDVTGQWYVNSTDSTEGGEAIKDATEPAYTIPSDLEPGDYYYYCVITAISRNGAAASAVTNTVKHTVAAPPESSDVSSESSETSSEVSDTSSETSDAASEAPNNPSTGAAFPMTAAAVLVAAAAAALTVRKRRA